MTTIIRGGRLLDPASGTDTDADVVITGDRITAIGKAAELKHIDASTVIDATGHWLTPGFVDIHVHLREPGEEYKEDIDSGSQAAAFGGFTSVVAMPNTIPVLDTAELVRFVRERGDAVGLCRILPTGAITVGQKGKMLAPMAEMQQAGAVAVTDDGRPVENSALMRSALEYAKGLGLPVLTHAEDLCLSCGGHMHEGQTSTRLGIPAVSRVAEDAIVARDVMLAEYTGAHLHVCHVSTRGAVDIIRDARARGAHITGEATPHHFSLTDHAVAGYNTSAKMNPPLREETDRLAVIEGLRDGTLDAVATDHAPHSTLEKDVAFTDAANGILGLQTALPLALDLWRQYDFPLLQVIERLTVGPCRALGLPFGCIKEGGLADLAIINPDATWTFSANLLKSRSKNSPFLGKKLTGRVERTILQGKTTFCWPTATSGLGL